MKVLSLSSPLPWIVHRGNWKDFRQAFSPLWSYSQGAWVSVSVRICGYTLGHTFGVRVDGAAPRGLWPPDGGRLCRRVAEKGS